MRRSYPHKVVMGSAWIGDWWNPLDDVSDVASAAEDAWNSAVDAVPGARAVADAVDSVVTGPVRDFAHTAVGQIMFTALASSLTGGLAPLLGPQLATVAFALPGLAKGETFAQAWTQEFASRVKQTAAVLGDQAAADAANIAGQKISDWITSTGLDPSKIDWSKIDFHQLASKLGIREDYTDLFIAGATGDLTDYLSRQWDPKTGKEIPKPPSFAQVLTQRAMAAALVAQQKALAEQKAGAERRGVIVTDPGLFRASTVVRAAVPTAAPILQTETVAGPQTSAAAGPTASAGFLSSLSTGQKVLMAGGAVTLGYGLVVALRAMR